MNACIHFKQLQFLWDQCMWVIGLMLLIYICLVHTPNKVWKANSSQEVKHLTNSLILQKLQTGVFHYHLIGDLFYGMLNHHYRTSPVLDILPIRHLWTLQQNVSELPLNQHCSLSGQCQRSDIQRPSSCILMIACPSNFFLVSWYNSIAILKLYKFGPVQSLDKWKQLYRMITFKHTCIHQLYTFEDTAQIIWGILIDFCAENFW